MNTLILSVVLVCSNCCDTGFVDLPCKSCNGSGVVQDTRLKRVNRQNLGKIGPRFICCRSCSSGLYSPSAKGSGVTKVKCPICKGKKNKKRP